MARWYYATTISTLPALIALANAATASSLFAYPTDVLRLIPLINGLIVSLMICSEFRLHDKITDIGTYQPWKTPTLVPTVTAYHRVAAPGVRPGAPMAVANGEASTTLGSAAGDTDSEGGSSLASRLDPKYSSESVLLAGEGARVGAHVGSDSDSEMKAKEIVVLVMVLHGEQPLIPLLSYLVTMEGREPPTTVCK